MYTSPYHESHNVHPSRCICVFVLYLYNAHFQVAAVSPVKEPYAFKKIRQKLELRQAFRGSSKGGVVSSGAAVITPKELEFIPLDAPLGKEREQGER